MFHTYLSAHMAGKHVVSSAQAAIDLMFREYRIGQHGMCFTHILPLVKHLDG